MLDPIKLRDRRLRKKWTQDDLAREAGLSRNVVAKLEAVADYDPSLSTVETIARAIGCGIGMLLSEGGVKERAQAIQSMGIVRGRPKMPD